MLQDPESIKREAAGPSGDVYTVVTKVKKGSKKNDKSGELPMHSEEDKSTKKEQERVSMQYHYSTQLLYCTYIRLVTCVGVRYSKKFMNLMQVK